MKKILNTEMKKLTFILLGLMLSGTAFAQVESPSLSFNRGQLWQSVFFGKIGPNFSNWGRRGIGLDWPGFDETWINQDIGGAASHMVTGGFWIGAKKNNHPDSLLNVEDWSMYATTITNDPGGKYLVTKHQHNFKNGENFYLKKDKKSGEEVIETIWQYNMNYTNVDDRERQLPVRVRRTIHQWNGSRADENYLLYEYTIKNISNEIKAIDPTRAVADTLYDLYLLANYGLQVNSRSWKVLFPTLSEGARNTLFDFDFQRNMIFGKADDYPETQAKEFFGLSPTMGRLNADGQISGEWLAPGFVGIRLLYSTPDNTGQDTRVNKYGWSAGSNTIDLSGPFTGKGLLKDKYAVLEDPAKATNFVAGPFDNIFMRKSRMWSMMSLGPWTILPGDSIVIAWAEIVNGVDYKTALDTSKVVNVLDAQSRAAFRLSADKAYFTYQQKLAGNGFNHPDPPAAPSFTVDYYKGPDRLAANVITFGNETELIPDPDDNTLDLAGYNVYRSDFLPIGPWDKIATITKGDTKFYDNAKQKYVFIDSSAKIGTSYYYAVTAYDTGKASWPVDPTAIFPDTKTNKVAPLESSIFANRLVRPFLTTFASTGGVSDVKVVPNPFVLGDAYSSLGSPGSSDLIQFVNIPNPCTIRIYTIRGDLVKTIRVSEGAGAITSWDQVTDYGLYVESGVYVFHIDSPFGTKTGKFAIVR